MLRECSYENHTMSHICKSDYKIFKEICLKFASIFCGLKVSSIGLYQINHFLIQKICCHPSGGQYSSRENRWW